MHAHSGLLALVIFYFYEIYSTVQFKFYTCVCQYTCTCVSACLLHVKLKKWHAHALFHAILACAQLPVNTHDTLVMLITILHLVCHTTHVVYRYGRHV